MWGDHQQLQITSNRYQVNVNVLTIDSLGNGTIMKSPCTPNPALKEFAMLPEEANVKDVWLLYTNGNHYDALITADDPLMTIGTIEDIEKNDDEKESMANEKKITEEKKEEKFSCDKCEKIFLKKDAKNLHMNNAHNERAHTYTPGLAKRKVGRPSTKFTCEVCKIRMNSENELKNHMTTVHRYPKRTRVEIQKIASLSKSPPNKKVKDSETYNNSDIKDINISRLETKNACLVEAADARQEQLNKQAIIIGDLRENLEQVSLALEVKVSEFKRVEETNAILVESLVSKDDMISDLRDNLLRCSGKEDQTEAAIYSRAESSERSKVSTSNSPQEALPAGGGQEQTGATGQVDTPAGEANVLGDEIFLADEARWENMDNGEEKGEDQENESRDVEQEAE